MIDGLSSHWKKACELVDYTYPEDLEDWVCPDDGSISISSSVLDSLSPGDVIGMNGTNYSYQFLFSLLRNALLDYTPFAMLSFSEEAREFQNRMLFSFLCAERGSDEDVLDFLSVGSILSKRLRAKRFCEFEDELALLSSKGYRLVAFSYGPSFPYLDAESKEKGYWDQYDALKKVAMTYGLSLIVFSSFHERKIAGIRTLTVTPERNRLILAPPEEVTVIVDGEERYRFHIDDGSRIRACFRIKGRDVILSRRDG